MRTPEEEIAEIIASQQVLPQNKRKVKIIDFLFLITLWPAWRIALFILAIFFLSAPIVAILLLLWIFGVIG